MDKRKLFISILAGIMAAVMLLGLVAGFIPTKAHAATSSELKAQLEKMQAEKKVIDAKVSEIKGKITENNNEMKEMVEQKNLIDQEITLIYEQIDNITGPIATSSLLIAAKQEPLSAAENNFAELNEKNKARIQAMEEEGEVSYWSVLFQANNFSDLLDRLNMVKEIAAADKRRLEELDKAAKEVSAAKEALAEEKAALEVTKDELNVAQAELEVKRTEADALLSQLVEKGLEFEEYMDEAEDQQAQLAKEIANKKDEYDKAKYQEWLATSQPPANKPAAPSSGNGGSTGSNTVGGIKWKTPINYTRFASPYGWRIHPIYGTKKFHYGVDLSAPSGTPIYATRGGTVSIAS